MELKMDYSNNAEFQQLLNPSNQASMEVYVSEIEQQARTEAMLELVRQKGFKLGINDYLKEARQTIETQERALDTIYNFQPLMIQERVIPPVIIESKSLLENLNPLSLKTTGVVYKIEKNARFSTRAPNYRQYLSFPNTDENIDYVTFIPTNLLPKNSQERALWTKEAEKSYKRGLNEGANILKDAFGRLNKDYVGMVKFHEFEIQGKLSMPAISSQFLAVASTPDSIALDMNLLQIQKLPSFNVDLASWKTTLKPEVIKPSGETQKVNLVSEP